MVEQPDRLLNKADSKLTRGLEARLVVLAASGRRDVLNAGAPSTVDVVGEREEGIARAGDLGEV